MKRLACLVILATSFCNPAFSQNPHEIVGAQGARAVDEAQFVRLSGTVHPLAQARYDRGPVPDAFPAERLLLLLQRSPEKEAALQQYLADAHRPGSNAFHQWLTPQEFGERFGPTDEDIQTAENWLSSHGFSVSKISRGRQYLEFSGTAGRLREEFRTEIHQYDVEGETHYANATEVSIPAALATLVRGISPLHDFRAKPYVRIAGEAAYSRSTRQATPLWTIANPFGTPNPNAYPVAPEDFATQYDLGPLYQAGITGTGQTIGIINESNIDLSLVAAYQQLFNLPNNPTQVVIDGADPGTLQGIDIEAYLDVEVSGAVAPKATVNLYISSGSTMQDPLMLAAIRAVEDNQASVLSVSFGSCEASLGSAGNQFWSSLWEQAAAQGQTVLVASGDSGPMCYIVSGVSVSGIASTPWNVAVGGTDFYYSDYASGGASATTLWNAANDMGLGSLKATLPEQPWNDGYGLDIIANGLARNEFGAGGGGPSSCITRGAMASCVAGYAKPAWQSGPGVPGDSSRDLPDVSLFASNGANLSGWPICGFAGECAAGTGTASLPNILIVGGTSASTPAMAGIMALVNQKYGRQGQANFTFYPLAQQKPSAFHDITVGSNIVPCLVAFPECVKNASGKYVTPGNTATPNYDLASGLGSVDASVLVNNWNSIVFKPTTTTLHLSATSVSHGTPVTVTTSVNSSTAGSSAPTGDVAILTTSPLPSSQSQTFLTLAAGTGTATIDSFPGGFYDVSAAYHGDGVYGGSTSSPVALTVTPENSTITLSLLNGQAVLPSTGASVAYNAPFSLSVQPVGISAPVGKTNGIATGTVTFTIDKITSIVPLDASGIALWNPPALAIGPHTASASYSGDASFNASTAAPATFAVAKGQPFINDNIFGVESLFGPVINVTTGGSLSITIVVAPNNPVVGVAAPTGTVTACLSEFEQLCQSPVYSQTATLASPNGNNAQEATATVTFTNLAAGYYFPSFSYSGDGNWNSGGLIDLITIQVGPAPSQAATTTALTITPTTVEGSDYVKVTTTVSGMSNSGTAPTGIVSYFDNGVFLTFILFPQGKTGSSATVSFNLKGSSFWNNGSNQMAAIYQGDANYAPSTSATVNVTATQMVGDFTITPQSPQLSVKPANSGTVGLTLTSLKNFNGPVSLTCATPSANVTCSVNPPTPMLNGTVTASLTVTVAAQAASLAGRPADSLPWQRSGSALLLATVLLGSLASRKRSFTFLLNLGLFTTLLVAGCSSGGGGISPPPPPPPPPSNYVPYSVVVSGTANGIVHNAKITVLVP